MIYAIALNGLAVAGSLHPNWDACWDAIWQHQMQELDVSCAPITVRPNAAPTSSLRPRARP